MLRLPRDYHNTERIAPQAASAALSPTEADLVRRALARDGSAVRSIVQTHNRRLYRLARSILRNDSEAEDVVQETYVRAFTSLSSFRFESSLATWLSRIAINEALGRLRARRPTVTLADAGSGETGVIRLPQLTAGDDPERVMAQRQILRLVEHATDNIPDDFRTVFVMRVIEGMSVEETADLLGLRPETVKTRLHRARKLVREQVDHEIGPLSMDAFPFAGLRCARVAATVMARLGFPA